MEDDTLVTGHDVVFRVVQLERVSYDFSAASALVVLREAEGARRELTLPVALPDATSIQQASQHLPGRRPTTNELVVSIFQQVHVDVIAARIVRLDAGIYFGELDLMSPRGRRTFDCRPSDAIAFALRQVVPAPILVAQDLLTTP